MKIEENKRKKMQVFSSDTLVLMWQNFPHQTFIIFAVLKKRPYWQEAMFLADLANERAM